MQPGQRSESYRDEEATDQQTTWQHRYTLLFFPLSCCLMSLTSSPTIIIDCIEAKAHLHFFAYSTLQHSCFEVSTTDGATPRISKKYIHMLYIERKLRKIYKFIFRIVDNTLRGFSVMFYVFRLNFIPYLSFSIMLTY